MNLQMLEMKIRYSIITFYSVFQKMKFIKYMQHIYIFIENQLFLILLQYTEYTNISRFTD